MTTELIDPQPFDGAGHPQRLVERSWRFYRNAVKTGKQEYMDIPEPTKFLDPKYRIYPIDQGGIWYWSVTDMTLITSKPSA